MTPVDLYTLLSTAYPQYVVDSVCSVEKNCIKNGFCPDKQNYLVLDFDGIKNEKCRGSQTRMPASVDAVCVGKKQEYFCFVELKGWKNYWSHFLQQKQSIKETADGYNLDCKLSDSQDLCKQITSDPDLFAHMPTIFLLVTDIDVKTHGIESFADNLFTLTGTSTDFYSQCVSAAKRTLDSEVRIDHDYIYCKDFNNYIAGL